MCKILLIALLAVRNVCALPVVHITVSRNIAADGTIKVSGGRVRKVATNGAGAPEESDGKHGLKLAEIDTTHAMSVDTFGNVVHKAVRDDVFGALTGEDAGAERACKDFHVPASCGVECGVPALFGHQRSKNVSAVARSCDRLKAFGWDFAPFFGRFLTHQLQPRSMLEIGCSSGGALSDYVARFANASVICIENSRALATFAHSLHGQGSCNPPGVLRPLALDALGASTGEAACMAKLIESHHDLVLAIEVAEQLPSSKNELLVATLASATRKWLVFSGTARVLNKDLGTSSSGEWSTDRWQKEFEAAGLVHMPKLSTMARQSTWRVRSNDLKSGLLVFRHPSHHVEDTDVSHPMLAHMSYGGLDWNRWDRAENALHNMVAQEWSERGFAMGATTAIWPELGLMEHEVRRGWIPCVEASKDAHWKSTTSFIEQTDIHKLPEYQETSACSEFMSSEYQHDPNKNKKDQDGKECPVCTHVMTYGLNLAPFVPYLMVHMLKPRTMLEFGCGLGTTSDLVARLGHVAVTAIEPDRNLQRLTSILHGQGPGGAAGSVLPLALDVTANSSSAASCAQELAIRKVDLVYSAEVLEHIPEEFHPQIVKFMADSVGKWMVFSAARPGQGGTGHLKESMKTHDEWRAIWERAGLVFMPKMTQLARKAAGSQRDDLKGNIMVLKHPSNPAEDTQESPYFLKAFSSFYTRLGDGDIDNITDFHARGHAERGFRHGVAAMLWPDLSLIEAEAVNYMMMPPESWDLFVPTGAELFG